MAKRDLLSITDIDEDLPSLLERAHAMKLARRRGDLSATRPGRYLAMIFEKPSTRTRTSFEVAMTDLGGHALYMSSKDLQLGRGETIADTARVLSRYVDAIAYRANRSEDMAELAQWSAVPVLNALDNVEHPCQIVADLLTMYELWEGKLEGHRLAYIGDGNNVCNSLMLGCARMGIDFVGAIPEKYRPPERIWHLANRFAARWGSSVEYVTSPKEAAKDADILYTDVWVSMGDEQQAAERQAAFDGYRIDAQLLAAARPAARVMHDLPAHRGMEITDDVMDGPQGVMWDQAENRLHAQKAILEKFIPPRGSGSSPMGTGRLRGSPPG
ncbi:MAG: ornithine carbamoyltransferase [Thermoplasmata archaeon]|nr:ornithine carbamoyltransferase [Thermoplasmata archaeon]